MCPSCADVLLRANQLLPLLNSSTDCAAPVPVVLADYKKLGVLKQQFPDTPIIALTATATMQASKASTPGCV